jgi:outer membrane protein OmpA-like peptidoglycan-associated protein
MVYSELIPWVSSTNTSKAFQLFLDSLSSDHPSAKMRLVLFSDISGNRETKLDSLMQVAYEKGIQTDRVIYSKWIKKRRFTKKGKERFFDVIHSNYGRTYVINSLGSISSCLKDFMNEECLASRVLIPLDSVGKYEYRLSLENEGGKQELLVDYVVEELPDSSVLQSSFSLDTLNLIHIEFATGSDKILEGSYTELNKVYDFLQHYPHVMIQLQGHTDNQGSYAYNMDLSARRAKAAMSYLLEKGIRSGRMRAEGFGYTRPIDSNDTPEGRQRNRRTEFVVIQQED